MFLSVKLYWRINNCYNSTNLQGHSKSTKWVAGCCRIKEKILPNDIENKI